MHPVRLIAPLLAGLILAPPSHGAVLTMGAGQTYTTLAAAVAAASAGDTIDVLAGTYVDQVATINIPLTIEGVGGTPVFTQTGGTELANLKGFLVVNASLTVDHLRFQGASISAGNGGNGAGIRYQGGDLTVTNSQFVNNQDGILAFPVNTGSNTGAILIQNSSFSGNGSGTGLTHAIYAGQVASLTVIGSTFSGTLVGHDIKSRAARTIVTGDTLDDGVSGTTSYAIDIAEGGNATITGNTISQGPNTQNSTMLSYAAEGVTWTDNALQVMGNVFLNTNASAIGVNNHAGAVTASVSCNAFSGVTVLTQGLAVLTGNATGTTTVPACGQAVPEPPVHAILLTGLLLLLGARLRWPAPRARA